MAKDDTPKSFVAYFREREICSHCTNQIVGAEKDMSLPLPNSFSFIHECLWRTEFLE